MTMTIHFALRQHCNMFPKISAAVIWSLWLHAKIKTTDSGKSWWTT